MKKIGIILGIATMGLLASCSGNNTTSNNVEKTSTNNQEKTSTVVETTTGNTTSVSTTTTTKYEGKLDVSIIAPEGTPALGLANFKATYSEANFTIANGADPLRSAFSSASHDIIVAPVNLGSKFFNTESNQNKYVLAKTFVWGNLFLASKTELTSFADLNGKDLVVFGQNSTPDILTKILLKENNITANIQYVGTAADANAAIKTGNAEYAITAEPAITKAKAALGVHVLDLQDEYSKVTGKSSYPQAGIFIKASSKEDLKTLAAVDALIKSVEDTNTNPAGAAKNAVSMHKSFETLGEEVLTKAIPNCHYQILSKEAEKAAVLEFLQKMIDSGFSAQVGGKVPSAEFFL